jgi:ubiquinone/menaquinone biosynthesis C-methylase UbiE
MAWDEQRMSFGAIAETYDSYRPDWPAATAAWLTGTEEGGPLVGRSQTEGLDVLDLGAGTGKLTRPLVEAGLRVTAVDPSEGMLGVLHSSFPQVRALIGTGEAVPVDDASVDVITVAQAWHWLRQPEAALECARVVRPGGLLAIAWHRRTSENAAWMGELDVLTEAPYDQALENVRSHRTPVELTEQFGSVEQVTFGYEHRVTPAGLAALASSWSYVNLLPDRDQVLEQVEALGRRSADPDGMLTIPHLTHCFRATRLA